ncbi:MAG: four-carbon acid sugar kinase family protein, partial [Bacteroidota bacterium]
SASSVTLIALPLKFEAGDGSPCRVIALEAKKQAPMKFPVRDLGELMTSLPAQQSEERLDAAIQWALWDRYDLVIVLDDDPTGTQTVHNIPVLTELNEATLANELARGSKFFYLLTNSRAYPAKEVAKKTEALGKTIRAFCQSSNLKPLVIIRGDSTLRGHFDQEDLALAAGLGLSGHYPFLIPAFFEGGRYTINDVHYVQEGQQLIPAAQTPFAEDKTFGYSSSDLKEWVTEKASAIGQPTTPISISITNLRTKFPTALRDKIAGKQTDQVCIINAADYTDLKRAALAILRFAYKPLIRSSASFVAALLGQPQVPFLTFSRTSNRGALFLVGSHVPRTTAQVEHLLVNFPLAEYQIHVRSIVEDPSLYLSPAEYAEDVDRKIATGVDVVIYTSREFFAAPKGKKNLDISRLVSTFCLSIIRELKVQPSLLVTKGGITSSDVATEALGVKRAVALGQVQPGVPTWELGPESKFPGMPFIIFPGNVGQEDSLSSILQNTLI